MSYLIDPIHDEPGVAVTAGDDPRLDANPLSLPESAQQRAAMESFGRMGLDAGGAESAMLAARMQNDDRLVLFRANPEGGIDDSLEQHALVNPTTFGESWEPQYAKRGPLGSSQEVMQYIRTASRTITMDLWISWQIFIQMGIAGPEKGPLAYRDFFSALTVPCGRRLAPPVVDVIWPRTNAEGKWFGGDVLSFSGVVESLSFEYERFSNMGEPLEYTIKVKFLEVLSGLMTYSRVLANGFGNRAT